MLSHAIIAQLKQEENMLRNLAPLLHQTARSLDTARTRILELAEQRAAVDFSFGKYNARTPKDEENDYDPDYAPPLIVRDLYPSLKATLTEASLRASDLREGWDALQLDRTDTSESGTTSYTDTNEDVEPRRSVSLHRPVNLRPSIFPDAPAEILSNILGITDDNDINTTMAVSQVSQKLRQTVVSSPLLWTRIDINLPTKRNAMHMERSVGVPNLEIHASLSPWRGMTLSEGVDRVQRFWSLLEMEAHRIQDLHMVFGYPEWLQAAMPILAGATRNLRFLDVGLHGDFGEEVLSWDGSAVPCQPQFLRMRGRPAWNVQDSFWRRVEDFQYMDNRFFHFSSEGLAAHFERLGLMRDVLRSLHLSDLHFSDVITMHKEASVVLTELTHLELSRVDDHGLGVLWKLLQTPQLESLTIFFKRGYTPTLSDGSLRDDSFVFQIIADNPQLVNLDLTDFQLNPPQWNVLFERLPNLKRLRIAGSELHDHSLSPLYNSSSDHCDPDMPAYKCNALTHLVLENAIFLRSDVVWNIVSVRYEHATSHGGAKLQSVIMRGFDVDHVREEDVQNIRNAVDHFVLEVFNVCSSEGSVDSEESEDFEEVDVSGDEWFKAAGSGTSTPPFLSTISES
ncbi:hypothetical protein FRB94_009862 [Tulasnella sp. JGI-2019a]|nr:hypothetical protein FRB94_009862 [Tulasnella sp. JGI-2019a]